MNRKRRLPLEFGILPARDLSELGLDYLNFGIWVFRSLAIHTLHPHPQPIKPLARRDEKRVPILATEANIRAPGFRHLDLLDLVAAGIENRYAFASEINIAFVIDRHAVRAQLAEKFLFLERAVFLNLIDGSLKEK